jgi:hypothetical protein
MFGGPCFMVNGNMSVGVLGGELMVRVGLDHARSLAASPWLRKIQTVLQFMCRTPS